MKIGFSLSLCVNDILAGKVSLDEILVIVARTKFVGIEGIRPIMQSYVWDGRVFLPSEVAKQLHEDGLPEGKTFVSHTTDLATNVAVQLYETGKLHQPRLFGKTPPTVYSPDEVWMDLAPTNLSKNENVQKAWNQYQMLLKLSEDKMPKVPSHLDSKNG